MESIQNQLSNIEIARLLEKRKALIAKDDPNKFREYVIKNDRGGFVVQEPIHKAWVDHIDYCKKIGKHCAILAPWGHGKQLADSTPILTINGWTTHGKLKIGDYVYGRNGNPVKITGLSEKTQSQYRVYFSDGAEIECHGRHEWVVFDRNKKSEKVYETEYMYNAIARQKRNRFLIDNNVTVFNTEKGLPILPYTLGVWLGNGTSTSLRITQSKKDLSVIDKIENSGYKRTATWVHNTTGVYTINFGNNHNLIKNNNLFNNKHIPEIYFNASIKQRLELLAGLIDTDGYVDKKICRGRGKVYFTNINKKLIDDVERLLISLGFMPSVYKAKARTTTSGIIGRHDVYTIMFMPICDIPTVLPRKKIIKFAKLKKRAITKIIKVDGEQGNCIEVEGGIYLAGKTLIPTHNSVQIAIAESLRIVGNNHNVRIKIINAIDQYAIDRVKTLRNYIENSEEYNRVYPHVQRGEGDWTAHRIYVQRDSMSIDPTIEARGILSTGISGRADVLIFDDPVDVDSITSEKVRDSARMAYRNVWMSRLVDTGFVIYICTRWHDEDLTKEILDSGGYSVLIHRVSQSLNCITQERICGKKIEKMPSLELCSFFGVEAMKTRLNEIGEAAFNRGFRQMGVTDGELSFRHFAQCIVRGVEPPKAVHHYIGVDLSGEQRKGNVICVVGTDNINNKWVADIQSGNWSSPETAEMIAQLNSKYIPHVIMVENNAYQQSLIDWMSTKDYRGLPIQPFTTGKQKVSETIGLPALDVQFERGMWKFYLPDHDVSCKCAFCQFAKEMKYYPIAETSDSVMAFWFAERGSVMYGYAGQAFNDEDTGTKQNITKFNQKRW